MAVVEKQKGYYFSINKLSLFTGKDRRTVKKRLESLSPITIQKSVAYYEISKALERIYQPELKTTNKVSTLHDERTRLVKAQAQKAELELQELDGSLISVNLVKKDGYSLGRYMRESLEAATVRIIAPLPEKIKARVEKSIRKEHRQILVNIKNANKYG